MADMEKKGWVRLRLEDAIRSAFMKAYQTVKVDPDKYLEHLRMAYDLPALTYDGVYSVDPEILDHIAGQTIRASMRMAAAAGAGLGMGGMFTIVPDLGILAAITLRMLQKLSLIYGFPYNTEAGRGRAVDRGRQCRRSGHQPRTAGEAVRVEVRAARDSANRRAGPAAEIVEKWTARLIPVISSVIGAGLNYYFVKVWGERAIGHFRQKTS